MQKYYADYLPRAAGFIPDVGILGYGSNMNALDVTVSTRGYRILNKTATPFCRNRKFVKEFSSFQKILKASTEQLDDVEGIGEVRAGQSKMD